VIVEVVEDEISKLGIIALEVKRISQNLDKDFYMNFFTPTKHAVFSISFSNGLLCNTYSASF